MENRESQKVLQREGEDKKSCNSASVDSGAPLFRTLKGGAEEIHRYSVASELHKQEKMRKWSSLRLSLAGFCRSHLVKHSTTDVRKEFESLRLNCVVYT